MADGENADQDPHGSGGDGAAETIAILPLGASEQHGPHLPVETDWMIADALADRLCRHVDQPLERLPTERIGYSPEHLAWPEATRTLTYDEAIERWIAIGEALADRGIRKLLLLNAHGGNSPLLTIVQTELRMRRAMLVAATNWHRFIEPGRNVSAEERALGIHAGQIETSVMLAIAPERVAMDKAARFPSRQCGYASRYTHLRAYGPHPFGWAMQDLNAEGAVGDAASASAELGERLLEEACKGLRALIADMARFDLADFAMR